MPGVTERLDSAFGMTPEPVDWLFSDVIAYPDRLLALVRRWIDAGAARHIVCTIKFQGATDHEAAEAFAAIPGGRVTHLFHNKHELTFLWDAPNLTGLLNCRCARVPGMTAPARLLTIARLSARCARLCRWGRGWRSTRFSRTHRRRWPVCCTTA